MILHTTFTPSERTINALLLGVMILGTFTLLTILLAAFIAVVSIINLALDVAWSLYTHIAAIYAAGDPLVKLLIICIVLFLLSKLALRAYRSLRASL